MSKIFNFLRHSSYLKYHFILSIFETTGPSPTVTTSIAARNIISNNSDIYQGPFHLHSPALGTRVQQLWLLAEVITDNDDGKSVFVLYVDISVIKIM